VKSRRESAREREAVLEAALARFVDVCRRMPDVKAVYAFGSLGRGEVGPASDLDILVVRDTAVRGADRDRDLRIAFNAPVPLDLVVVTPEEYAQRLPATAFGRTILAEARLVHAA
jgi:predicted nucleotidyltransferase